MDNRKRFLGVVLFSMVFLVGCHADTEKEKVVSVITAIEEAAEKKAIKKILGNLSRQYKDPQGHDYQGIKGLLVYYFFRHEKVSVYITSLNVTVQNAGAHAAFQAVLTGAGTEGSDHGLLPSSLGMYDFTVLFIKESGDWKVIAAQWHRTGEGQKPGSR